MPTLRNRVQCNTLSTSCNIFRSLTKELGRYIANICKHVCISDLLDFVLCRRHPVIMKLSKIKGEDEVLAKQVLQQVGSGDELPAARVFCSRVEVTSLAVSFARGGQFH